MRRSAVGGGSSICLALAWSLTFGTSGAANGNDGGFSDGHFNGGDFRLLKLDGYHVKWGENALGAGATVSYAFVDVPMHFDGAINCGDLVPINDLATRNGISSATLHAEAAAAFRIWEEAANITFIPADSPDQADILIGAQGQPVGRAFANVVYHPGSNVGVKAIDRALVCLNPDQRWKVGFDGDTEVYDIRYTLVHEIGHAIGLDHPGPSGQVMSFRYNEQYSDLQPGDFHGVQLLYGIGTRNMTAGGFSE
jgi:hypothetical protein